MTQTIIDLNDARIPANSEILSGRDCGKTFRRRFELDKRDKSAEPIEVAIPDEVISMNTSFFLGLFGRSVRTLGPARFRLKYRFKCDPIHMASVEEGIERAIKESDIFTDRESA